MASSKIKLSAEMNWLDIGRYILQEKAEGVSREDIEKAFIKRFGWTDAGASIATKPYFKE